MSAITPAVGAPDREPDAIRLWRLRATERHFARLAEKKAEREARAYQRGRPPSTTGSASHYAGDNWWVGGE